MADFKAQKLRVENKQTKSSLNKEDKIPTLLPGEISYVRIQSLACSEYHSPQKPWQPENLSNVVLFCLFVCFFKYFFTRLGFLLWFKIEAWR